MGFDAERTGIRILWQVIGLGREASPDGRWMMYGKGLKLVDKGTA